MRSGPLIRRTRDAATLGLLLLALGGCIRLGGKPPARLIGVVPESRVEVGKPVSAAAQDAIFVELPDTPKTIDTQRVAVREDANAYAYVKDALWVDTPARQFQAVLSETIAAKTGRLVLDPGQYPAHLGHIVHGELTEFGIDALDHRAVVTFDASFLDSDGLIRHQRFSATRPLRKIDADTVAPAINAAANEVAAAVADWIGKP